MARNIGADKIAPESLLDVLIHAGLIAISPSFCYRVFHPFMDLLLWSMIPRGDVIPAPAPMAPPLRDAGGLNGYRDRRPRDRSPAGARLPCRDVDRGVG